MSICCYGGRAQQFKKKKKEKDNKDRRQKERKIHLIHFLFKSLEQRDSKYPIMVSERRILVYVMLFLFVSALFEYVLDVLVYLCVNIEII